MALGFTPGFGVAVGFTGLVGVANPPGVIVGEAASVGVREGSRLGTEVKNGVEVGLTGCGVALAAWIAWVMVGKGTRVSLGPGVTLGTGVSKALYNVAMRSGTWVGSRSWITSPITATAIGACLGPSWSAE